MAVLTFAAYALFIALLLAACITDLRARLIPNWIVISMCAIWFLWQIVEAVISNAVFLDAISNIGIHIVAALVFGCGLLVFTLVFEAITHKNAMGGGDIKLLAVCTLYLGLQDSVLCLLIACIASIPLALIIPHTRFAQTDERKGALPFAPAIAVGALVAMGI